MTDIQAQLEAQVSSEITKATKTQPLVKEPERLESRLKEIPPEPGVYFMRDASDRIIYIG